MTTAHKPTWHSAKGGYEPERKYSSKDLPAHLKLKERIDTQKVEHDPKKIDIYKRELLEREQEYKNKSGIQDDGFKMPRKRDAKAIEKGLDEFKSRTRTYEESLNTDNSTPFLQDADYNSSSDSDDDSKSSNSSASEDDEDEAALLREYAMVKREREQNERMKEEEKAKEIEEKEKEEIMNDNPLSRATPGIKRKWYDETVFKNQARVQQKQKKRFINDTVRSDFHKDFLNRFIH